MHHTPEERRIELVTFLNRVLMHEQAAVELVSRAKDDETDAIERERLARVVDDDRRAIDLAERAIRELGGKPSAVRRTVGTIATRTWLLAESVPNRVMEAVRSRDVRAAGQRLEGERLTVAVDAYVAEMTAHANWRLLADVADAAGEPALRDAVREAEPAAEAHVTLLRERAERAARERLAPMASTGAAGSAGVVP